MYVPATAVFTFPLVTIALVRFPSKLSVAVAPNSVYTSPTFKSIVAFPFSVITGAVVSAITLTVRVTCVVFPDESLTV